MLVLVLPQGASYPWREGGACTDSPNHVWLGLAARTGWGGTAVGALL